MFYLGLLRWVKSESQIKYAGMVELVDTQDLGAVTLVKVYCSISGAVISKTEYAPVMELVDMRDLGSRAAMRVGSSPFRRTKIKGHLLCRCPFILGFAARRAAPPFGISMLGAAEPPLRRGFACGKTLVRRTRAAGQKAGWVQFCPLAENLKIFRL